MNDDIEYINFLMQSYMDAEGLHNVEINSSHFLKQFKKWLIKRQICINKYIYLLEKMNLDFKKSYCVEVGKGFLDSVVVRRFSTSIASPYSNHITRNERFLIVDGVSYHSLCYGENKYSCVGFSSKDKIFMTQNPYTKDELDDWHELHNSGNYDIIVGVYGNIFDKDREEKIEQIIGVKNKLVGDEYIMDELTIDNTYSLVLASKRKSLKIK